jgi:hypothetical protein
VGVVCRNSLHSLHFLNLLPHSVATEGVALESVRAAHAERKIVLRILTHIVWRQPVILDCHSLPNCLYSHESFAAIVILAIIGDESALARRSIKGLLWKMGGFDVILSGIFGRC